MWTRLIIVALIVMAATSAWGQTTKQVRDSSGRLIEQWSQRGSTTTVRDRNSTILETRTQRGSNITVRDKNGRLIGTEKFKK